MPFDWTAERERQMLLMAIQQANLKPTMQLWSSVAASLGGGLTPSAVSQKYYKLKNESAKLAGRGASALSNPLGPRPGRYKIAKSAASTRIRKSKQNPKISTADVSEPEDQAAPNPQPSLKAIADVHVYKAHKDRDVKQEGGSVKNESGISYVL